MHRLKRIFHRQFGFAAFVLAFGAFGPAGTEVCAADLKLWYTKPPVADPNAVLSSNGAWPDALLIGNGRLGGQVWGSVQQDRIDLNEDTLWTGEPGYAINPKAKSAIPEIQKLLLAGDYAQAQTMWNQNLGGKNSETYLPLGDIRMKFALPEMVQNYRRELDLDTAIVSTTFEADGVKYKREVFASHPAQAIIIHLTADQPGKISFSATLNSQLRNAVKGGDGFLAMTGQAPLRASAYSGRVTPPRYDTATPAKGMFWESRVAATNEGGKIHIGETGGGAELVAENCNAVTLTVVARTSYNGPLASPSKEGADQSALCTADLRRATAVSYESLRSAHLLDYQNLFRRVTLDLGHSDAEKLPTHERVAQFKPEADPGLPALYYQFGRYMMISASRPGGQPANLQGLWSASVNPPWSSNWTINCNAEINYWPVEAANLGECHEPLIQMVQELSVDGARVAKDFYGVRGWMAHHGTDIWKFAVPCGSDARWSSFMCGGSWLSLDLWERYAFSGDAEYLKKVWPTLKGAAQFHLDMLVEEPKNHWLVMAPDVNFENQWKKPDGTQGALCYGATPSTQIIRELFSDCVMASKVLNVDADFRAELEKALPRLAPMQVSPTTGQLQEYIEDWGHTAKAQVLSSWGAVRSAQINPRTTPELAAGLKKIFDTERWWEKDCLGSWEGAFQANSYARLHDPETAVTILNLHLQKAVMPNLGSAFLGHPPSPKPPAPPHPGMFQVDGNFGQTSAINEMLLQSQMQDAEGIYEIELLAALPKAWASGEVHGLRARGGFQVDMTWQSGRLSSARITSTAGTKTHVRYGDKVLDLTLAKGGQKELTAESFK